MKEAKGKYYVFSDSSGPRSKQSYGCFLLEFQTAQAKMLLTLVFQHCHGHSQKILQSDFNKITN